MHVSNWCELLNTYYYLKGTNNKIIPCILSEAAIVMASCDNKSNVQAGSSLALDIKAIKSCYSRTWSFLQIRRSWFSRRVQDLTNYNSFGEHV